MRENRSYGLTTLRHQHVDVDGATLRLRFRRKGGKARKVSVTDRRLAAIVRRCQELPGQELFRSVDHEGRPQSVDSADVNEYLKSAGGEDVTAKDFRDEAITNGLAGLRAEAAAVLGRLQQRLGRAVERDAARAGRSARPGDAISAARTPGP